MECPECNGDGEGLECSNCLGDGVETCDLGHDHDCESCLGLGYHDCDTCLGAGELEDDDEETIKGDSD